MKFRTKIRASFFLVTVVATMFACKLFQEENQTTTKQGFYVIQPETLIETLTSRDDNPFVVVTQQDVDRSRSVPPTGPSVNWKQSDYFHIVDAFYKLMLHDTLDDWQLRGMSFSLSCAERDIGLQDGRFEFFKIVKNENNQEVLISRFIDVDPRYKVVLLWEREFYPYVITRSSIDLNSIRFDSEKVLQIAEESGGQKLRLSLNNECSIGTSLSPDSAQYRGWNVMYIGDESNLSAFEINVDPFTGTIQ